MGWLGKCLFRFPYLRKSRTFALGRFLIVFTDVLFFVRFGNSAPQLGFWAISPLSWWWFIAGPRSGCLNLRFSEKSPSNSPPNGFTSPLCFFVLV